MDLEFFRRRLIELQNDLIRRYSEAAGQTDASLDDRPSDIMDLASDSFEDDLAATLSEQDANEIASIRRALQLMDQGEYGKCEECNAQINPARLEARPFATLCLKCQQEFERMDS